MFESAEQYSSMAQDHVNEALYILTRYEHEVNGGDDEIVLDVGCGSGDVTVQVLGRMKRWKQIVRVVHRAHQQMIITWIIITKGGVVSLVKREKSTGWFLYYEILAANGARPARELKEILAAAVSKKYCA
ncbi:unnamed protein product [Nesidiocoris tenuis]|uniref:Methyltransferase domain-containing protein n=1 Tax=Nesidiocoris tenuis TaxID=355587 RepID=A0A6H5GUB0_9HEMI|nr:unnamed protein product [Nesidiocoris tenuis]